jgi:hypothetical protein
MTINMLLVEAVLMERRQELHELHELHRHAGYGASSDPVTKSRRQRVSDGRRPTFRLRLGLANVQRHFEPNY